MVLVIALVCGTGAKAQDQRAREGNLPSPERAVEGVKSFAPKNGFVPDQVTAVRIAEAILIPIYGEGQIKSERPFKATLRNGVWTVTGTLPPQFTGGTAMVRLAKADGRVFFVIHEQ